MSCYKWPRPFAAYYVQQRGGPFEYRVLALLYRMAMIGFDNIPKTTLYSIIGMILLYIGWLGVPWDVTDKCMSLQHIWYEGEYARIILAQFEHSNGLHLYCNMAGFLGSGTFLEMKFGTLNFAILIAFLIMITGLCYTFLTWFMYHLTGYDFYRYVCGIGFSGIVYALEIIRSYERNTHVDHIFGEPINSRYSKWIAIIVNWMFAPQSSMMGHLSGIFAGFIYSRTVLRDWVDYVMQLLTGNSPPHYHENIFDVG